jgi:hypothetical protein
LGERKVKRERLLVTKIELEILKITKFDPGNEASSKIQLPTNVLTGQLKKCKKIIYHQHEMSDR